LRKLLEDVLRGLRGEPGDRPATAYPFGGKTHALVSLYHIATNRDKLQDFPELATLPNPGVVKLLPLLALILVLVQESRLKMAPF